MNWLNDLMILMNFYTHRSFHSILDRPQCSEESLSNQKIAIDRSSVKKILEVWQHVFGTQNFGILLNTWFVQVTMVDCHLDSHPPPSTVYWISSKQVDNQENRQVDL